MTAIPEQVQRLTWATLGRVLDAMGYAGIEERYLADEFWDWRVERLQF